MAVLMRSVSGIRGIVGNPLTPTLVLNYLNAFLQITHAKKVVVGRDTRISGPMFENIISQGCSAAGVDAVNLGLASTPTVEVMVPHLNADAGIIITASHNPGEWNALKFLNGEGIFLNEEEIQRLFKIVDDEQFSWTDYRSLGKVSTYAGADDIHIESILDLPIIDVEAIRKQKFKVAYDAVNGAGSLIVPKLLETLGCEMHSIYTTPNGEFPHNPEPTPENLKELRETVLSAQCDVGFATDPDGDRCAMVSEKGEAIGEEYTLVFATMLVLDRKKGNLTVNLSTSRMIEDLAEQEGCKVFRSKVGEINVSMLMKKNGSVMGGEGNGGVILPDLHYGRDGVLAIAMVLQLMANKRMAVSEIQKKVPAYHIEKQKIPLNGQSLSELAIPLQKKFVNTSFNDEDGLRFSWEKKWVHVRASNTEPVVRIIAEAPTKDEALDLCAQVSQAIVG